MIGGSILVVSDATGETAERVAAFAKENGLAMRIVLDPGGRTADLFGTEVTTTTVVIDGDGVLRYCGRFGQGEAALKAVLSFEITAGAVPAGAKVPAHWLATVSAQPCSASLQGRRRASM